MSKEDESLRLYWGSEIKIERKHKQGVNGSIKRQNYLDGKFEEKVREWPKNGQKMVAKQEKRNSVGQK